MEKRKLSKKTIFKLILALLSLAYLGFCIYAGITGKFPPMHETEYVMHFRKLKNWVSGGISSIILAALLVNSAINDLTPKNEHKKSFLPFFIAVFIPIIFLILLESYLDIGWAGIILYAVITAFLFGIALIPTVLNKLIARQLLSEKSMSGKQQMQITEWIHFYPLKKLLLLSLWCFGIVLILRGFWVVSIGKIEMNVEIILFLLGITILDGVFLRKIKRYVSTPYHCIPMLNHILSKNQLEQLLDGERFEPIQSDNHSTNQYSEVYQSQNWILVNGSLFSKKMTLCFTVDYRNHDSWLNVIYLNGMTTKIKVNINSGNTRDHKFRYIMNELIGCKVPLKLYEKEEQLAQKFDSLFPDNISNQERIFTFLSQDVTQIRHDFIQTFSQPIYTHNKKQSRQNLK